MDGTFHLLFRHTIREGGKEKNKNMSQNSKWFTEILLENLKKKKKSCYGSGLHKYIGSAVCKYIGSVRLFYILVALYKLYW